MDIVSKLPTRTVTDFVFAFVGGEKFTVTIGPDDPIETTVYGTTIQHIEDGVVLEIIVVEHRNLLYSSRTTREVTIYAAGQSPMELAIAQMTNTTTGVLAKHHVTYTQNLDNPTNPRQGNY